MPFALFHNGKQISKSHSVKSVVVTEAFEKGVLHKSAPDFPDTHPGYATVTLADGYEIIEVKDDTDNS